MTWLNSNSVLVGAFLCAGTTSKFMGQYHVAKSWGGARGPRSPINVCDLPPFASPSLPSRRRGGKFTTEHTETTEKVYSADRRQMKNVITGLDPVIQNNVDARVKHGHDGLV